MFVVRKIIYISKICYEKHNLASNLIQLKTISKFGRDGGNIGDKMHKKTCKKITSQCFPSNYVKNALLGIQKNGNIKVYH